MSKEVKQLTGKVFLERLSSRRIKAKELPPEMAGAQSNFILLTDHVSDESYIITLPKVPPSAINLKASVILRNYLSQLPHPNLIEFVSFQGSDVLIDKLLEYNDYARKWGETWTFKTLCEYLTGDSDSLDPRIIQYAAWFYDISCSKQAAGATLMKIFTENSDPAKCSKILQPFIQPIFQGLVAAALHIHALKHNHTDISPGNILVDQKTQQVKLIDINAARPYDEKGRIIFSGDDTSFEGTPLSIPPEVLIRDVKQDVEIASAGMDAFSIGVIFYQLLAGKQNVNIFNVEEKAFNTLRLATTLRLRYTELLEKPDQEIYAQIELSMKRDGITVDSVTKNLLCQLLHPNPLKRLQIHQIYSHPYFSNQTVEITREIHQAHKTALQIGNSYMAGALEKTYLPIFMKKILVEQILPYLEDFVDENSGIRIFNQYEKDSQLKEDIGTAKILAFTLRNYLKQTIDQDWIEEIAGMIAAAGQPESGQPSSIFNKEMQEFSKLIAPLISQPQQTQVCHFRPI